MMATGRKSRAVFFLIIFFSVLLTGGTGCEPSARHRTISFLFPQKPPVKKEKNPGISPAPKQGTSDTDIRNGIQTKPLPLVSHKPYIERGCGLCHVGASAFTFPISGENWDGIFRKGGGKPGPLILPKNRICVKCHEDLSTGWAEKEGLLLHTTAAKGECLKCHDAHQSRYPALLREDKETLCVTCHKVGDPAGVAKCFTRPTEPEPCLSCHNPHQGKNKSLLRKDYNEGKHPVSPKEGRQATK